MYVNDLSRLGALEAANAIRSRNICSHELVQACIERIEKREGVVNAWVDFDPQRAIDEARVSDEEMMRNGVKGPLHGVPVGLKDIIDTYDFPTQFGSDLFRGRRPAQDAASATFLRKAGAVIMGKTVTTEFALTGARATTNPHNEKYTPGGSSSGSAAAVADFMVPVALGSQTGGSMIRPASYCGVYGYKPTFGSISRRGVFILARVLDHLGIYGRSLEDIAIIMEQISDYDPADFDMTNNLVPKILKNDVIQNSNSPPKIAFIKGPPWLYIKPYMVSLFDGYLEKLNEHVIEVELSGIFDKALDAHKIIMQANVWHNLSDYRLKSESLLMPETVKRIDDGQFITAREYIEATELVDSLSRALDLLLGQYDIIITASATGEAPIGLASTGDAVFQRLWTLTGLPTITLPHLEGPNGLPIGVQVVGRKGKDKELFVFAKWLDKFMGYDGE